MRVYEFRKSLASQKLLRDKHIDEQAAVEFVRRFAKLRAEWPPVPSGRSAATTPQSIRAREDAYTALFDQSQFKGDDITIIARALLGDSADVYGRKLGTSLVFEASNAGNEFATIDIMSSAYNRSIRGLAELRDPRIAQARKHLETIGSAPAKVLCGRIAELEGNRNLAIQLWTDAMEDSQQAAREMGKSSSEGAMLAADRNTSSPWLDLANAYLESGHYHEAKWAIDIGCDLDDPTSHDDAASYYRYASRHGVSNSKWLYHISKAAASGLPKAMHELGCWYFQSRWPYLEDEVPDSLRPTPFDPYPPERGVIIEETEESAVFMTAAVPHTVEGRLKMALQWLEVAQGFNYAPSFLAAARIYLAETVDEDMATPSAAVNLSKARYRFKSKAEYDVEPETAPNVTAPPVRQVPNPLYGATTKDGHSIAADLIGEIFLADKACKVGLKYLGEQRRQQQQQENEKKSKQTPNVQSKQYPRSITKWLQHPISYSDFMDMSKGTLHDRATGTWDLLVEAKVICDQQNWSVEDHDGTLLYRPNLPPKRV